MATSVVSARVGRRFLVMDSSICVAVITGLPNWVAFFISCFCTSAICSMGISTPRSPRAIIRPSAASSMESICSRARARSILAMMQGVVVHGVGGVADGLDVAGTLHKGLAHGVEFLPVRRSGATGGPPP